MSELLIKIFGVSVICVTAILFLKRSSPDSALTLRMLACVMLACAAVALMTPIVEYVGELGESFGMGEEISRVAELLLKVLGIAFLTHTCAMVCRDSGEGSIAYYVELGGKIEIMLLSMPLLGEIVELSLELLEMS